MSEKKKLRLSDAMTTLRIIAVAIFALIISANPTIFGLIGGLVILALIFLTDGLDGQLARRFDGESKMGAFYDIVGDRIAETVLLVPFVYLQIANPFVLVFFICKDFLVDFQRFATYMQTSAVPFKQVHGPLATFLTASRFMRFFYAVIKLVMLGLFYLAIFDSSAAVADLAGIVALITVITATLRTLPSFVSIKV